MTSNNKDDQAVKAAAAAGGEVAAAATPKTQTTTDFVLTNGERPYVLTSSGAKYYQPVLEIVGAKIEFVGKPLCWYLDSSFCAVFHRFKAQTNPTAAKAIGASLLLTGWCFAVIFMAVELAYAFRQQLKLKAKVLVDRDGDGEIEAHEVAAQALENVSRGLSQNDTLKLKLLATPGFFERLIQLVEASSVKVTTRNHAAKSIEAMSGSADAQREMVVRGHHEVLLALMNKEACTLYARKTLATTICNLESLPENAPTLTRAGAIGALVAEQEADPRLVRQRVKVSVSRLALRAHIGDANVLAALPEAERELIARLAAAEQKAAEASPLHGVRATLIESGVLLYLHTAGGGAAWGLFESLRLQQPRSVMLQNVARTALVTCFVPILMVGGVVTAYNRVNKRTDSISEKFWLYFTVCVGLYPAQRMLTMVEKFAPLWLGGHIVGFASFFVWTIYTESDLLKSDNALLSEQQVGPPQKKKLVVLWEAKPRSADTVKAAVIGPQPLSAPAPQPKLDH